MKYPNNIILLGIVINIYYINVIIWYTRHLKCNEIKTIVYHRIGSTFTNYKDYVFIII